jgi:hypothetical protein
MREKIFVGKTEKTVRHKLALNATYQDDENSGGEIDAG